MFYSVFATMSALVGLMGLTGSQYYNTIENRIYQGLDRTNYVSSTYSSSYTSFTNPTTYNYEYLSFENMCTIVDQEETYTTTYRVNIYSSFNGYSGNLVGGFEFWTDVYNVNSPSDRRVNFYWRTYLRNNDNFNLFANVKLVFHTTAPSTSYSTNYLSLDFRHEQNGSITLPTSFKSQYSHYMDISQLSIIYTPMDNDTYTSYEYGQSNIDDAYNVGYTNGYNDGVDYASHVDNTALTIFTGIIDVALVPVNFFLAIFNFDVFGINIKGLVSALLTIAIVVIIIRVILGNGGGKSSDD